MEEPDIFPIIDFRKVSSTKHQLVKSLEELGVAGNYSKGFSIVLGFNLQKKCKSDFHPHPQRR